VPYQSDIGAALQQARTEAYQRGEFHRQRPNEKARCMSEDDYVAWGIAQTRASVPAALADLDWSGDEYRDEWRAAQVVVTGPDSLLDAQAFSGTHSVIDMTLVADQPTYHAVAPAPAEYLLALFGTTEPSVTVVAEAVAAHRLAGFARWQGMYLIGYSGAQPAEVFFVGHSGD
jgi:hypothetical protein